ncbi:MAG: hypothetical protein ACYC91_17450 [Solirubrobacteraceae bacterium]
MRRAPGWLGVGAITLLLVLLADAMLRHESGLSGDEPFYDRMAAHPSGPHNFPYAYRIVVPWMVHALPFSHDVSFTLIAVLAIAASAAALFELLGEFSIADRLATALAIGFALSPTLLVTLVRHGRSVDPASILVMTLGCLFIVRRQLVALAATILAGVAVREASIFLIPLAYAVWAETPIDRRALRDTIAVAALPVAAYLWLRTSIDAIGRQYFQAYTGSLLGERIDFLRTQASSGALPVELRRLAYTYGPVWLAAPPALRSLRFARRGLVLVLLCLVSMTFATDWGRIIFLSAPVLFAAAAYVVAPRRRLTVALVASLFALDLGYGIYMQLYGVRHGLDTSIGHRIPIY